MKQYQIALIAFASGIFAVTLIFGWILKRQDEIVSLVPQYGTPSSVEAFFPNSRQGSEADCEKTFPVERQVTLKNDKPEARLGELAYLAIHELLEGPTQEQKDSGYFTSINEGTKIQKIQIVNGVATADFSALDGSASGRNKTIAGSCKVHAIRSQITETLKQFPEIKEVVISVNGNSEEILQP